MKNICKILAVFCFLSVMQYETACAQSVSAYPSFADLAEKLLPSVVNISTLHDKESNDNIEEIETNIETIFNREKTNRESLGSGFIIDEDGFIITNNHVIDKASAINVVLADNTSIEAVVVGKDPKTDIALIKIDADKKLQPVTFGNSDAIRIADWILAIGNPFGLGGSVTAGIVSAKSRDIESGPYDNFIQTDASINQGSSGGPMFNLKGEVIGVNTAIFSTNGGNMGIGFAIPVNQIDFVIRQIKENGKVHRGWIGVKMQRNNPETILSAEYSGGVLISSVNENSSADKAGLKAGDIVLKIDGTPIDDTKNLSRMVAESPIGKIILFDVFREGKTLSLPVLIEEMPEVSSLLSNKENVEADVVKPITDESSEVSDISFGELNEETIIKYHLPKQSVGVMITAVRNGSDAQEKGLKEGNVITQIDNKIVLDVNDALQYLKEAKAENNRPVMFQVKDNDVFHFVSAEVNTNDQN